MTAGTLKARAMRRIVVVGNGIAGLTACDTLRAEGFDGELTVVGAEQHQPYSRPALSKALLHGSGGNLTAHHLPPPTHQATELLGVSAAGLDADARLLRLDDGRHLPYDGVVIASGARAKRPAGVPNARSSQLFTLRTIEDAVALKHRLAGRPSVIVMGGGPLGMEVASGCLDAGCQVTMVSNNAPLSRQLGGHVSGIFVAAAVQRGLRLVSSGRARVVAATGRPAGTNHDDGTGVALADGTVLRADIIVSAIGDEPNVEWLNGSGLLVDGTLQVDSRGRLRPDIVAAGDVAFFPTRLGLRRVPLWTSAIDQAKVAAAGLLKGDAGPEGDIQPYFWTEGFGLSLKAVGFTPVEGAPDYCEPGETGDSMLMRWDDAGWGTAAAVNYRIPIPKLRKLANQGPGALRPGEAAVHR
ncbi:NADPH-dependent 2,4-dienoyl-CoA reductase, sulfur reductase [Arthrobacter sp. 9V]|uniref:NAD(P)/FAD-dependent oxidoreductase n=1 Tax=Arthrobacter sp. 9V TaxID=2653132 RepID=UPI0012F09637|nr:NAD(P)/FAD-dependent oxidoreductase [Arthrobacter sp. 9V]VXC34001.1 NADPH-dependent 2,4-dienoyl-CoA reductase, sulfur reductase [Arthrobacter sp. 9V]